MGKACRWPRRMLDGAWIDSYFFNITRVPTRNDAITDGHNKVTGTSKDTKTANHLQAVLHSVCAHLFLKLRRVIQATTRKTNLHRGKLVWSFPRLFHDA